MKIQYLGTAAAEGWPAVFCRCEACERARALGGKNVRTRSQSLIDDELLVDLPPDTLLHAHQHGFPLPEVRHLIVTHSHQDHFYPEELLMRRKPFTNTPDGVLTVYGNEAVGAAWQRDGFDEPICAAFQYVPPFEWFQAGRHRVLPLLATHDRNEACYVYVVERDGQRIAYLNDTGLLPEASLRALEGLKCDLISMDCTTGWAQDGNNHMGLPDIPIMMQALRQIGCAAEGTKYVINHFSHNGRFLHDELVARGAEIGVEVSYDGLVIDI